MRAPTVLIVGVSLVFGLQAADIPADGRAAEWASRQRAGTAALQQHDYAEAIRLFGGCVSLSKTRGERLTAFASYGIALHRADRNTEAKSALEQALAEWGNAGDAGEELRREQGPFEVRLQHDSQQPGLAVQQDFEADRILISGVLASVDRSLGDYGSAEHVLRMAIGDQSASQGKRAALMLNLADLLREESRETEARAVLNEVGRSAGLSRQQQTSVMVETAEVTRDMGLWDESVALWNKIGKIAGGDHASQLDAVVAGGLGETWLAAGNLARAEPLLRRSLQLLRDDPGASLSEVATALAVTARLYIGQNRLALAEEALDEAIAKDEKARGPGHPQIAVLMELRATILSRRGETQAARDDLERARIVMSSHFGPNSTAVAGVLAALGDVEQRAKQPTAAVMEYGRAMQLIRDAGADNDTFVSGLLTRYAAALKAAHRSDEARALLRSFQPNGKVAGVQGFRAE